jgi:protoporphyrinogen/coproporphyrinogen III oxidase
VRSTRTDRIAVIGGGITGLAAAWELVRAGQQPVVFEADTRFGGKISASPLGAVPAVDEGADAFLARVPFAVGLAGELGLGDSLVPPSTGTAFVAHAGRLHAIPSGLVLGVPAGFGGLARSRLLSWHGKGRAALDIVLPRSSIAHDSLGRAVRDRFGDEVLDRLVDPLVGSINAGGADELSIVAATPQIAAAAERSRSILVGLRRMPPAGSGPVFLTPRAGMAALVERLVAALRDDGVDLRPSTPVASIEPDTDGEGCIVNGEPFAAAIVTTPAFAAAPLLRPLMADVADQLDRIPYAGVVMVSVTVPGESLHGVPDGSGYLVPKAEQGHVTAVSMASRKWAHWRQQDGTEVLRISLGRHGREAPLEMDDDLVVGTALSEVSRHLGRRIELVPTAIRITRWRRAFPQYLPHHLDLVDAIETSVGSASPVIALAGAGFRGIGIPACIRQGRTAAAAMTKRLAGLRE